MSSVLPILTVSFATFVANNRLSQLHLIQSWPIKHNQKGEMEMANATWYWLQSVTKTAQDNLVEVRITVAVDPDYQQPVTDVVSFFAKPQSSTMSRNQPGSGT